MMYAMTTRLRLDLGDQDCVVVATTPTLIPIQEGAIPEAKAVDIARVFEDLAQAS